MNYITQINGFYIWLETNELSASAINLWHALMHIANKTGWQDNFTVAMSVLEIKTGLQKQAIQRARVQLRDKGRISFKSRSGNQSAVYQLIPISEREDDFHPQSDTQSDTQHDTQSNPQSDTQSDTQSVPINKQNKNKQNKTKQNMLSLPKTASDVIKLFNAICVDLPSASELTNVRKKNIFIVHELLNGDFVSFFERVQASDFLTGRSGKKEIPCTFDWVINRDNAVKILEGNYDNGSNDGTREHETNPFMKYALEDDDG